MSPGLCLELLQSSSDSPQFPAGHVLSVLLSPLLIWTTGGWSPFLPSAPIPPSSHQTAASQSQPCEHHLKGAMRTGLALAQLVLQGAEPEASTEC